MQESVIYYRTALVALSMTKSVSLDLRSSTKDHELDTVNQTVDVYTLIKSHAHLFKHLLCDLIIWSWGTLKPSSQATV